MDFSFTEEQTSIRDLAREILEKEVTRDRLKAVERETDWFDRDLWSTLAEAGLVGLVVPEEYGGMGYGIQEACMILHEIGRAVAPVPLLPSLILGALPIGRFGSEAQKAAWLPSLASGETILSGALVEAGSHDPATPATTAHLDGATWILEGRKDFVSAVGLARRVVTAATTSEGVGVFLLDPQGVGVKATRAQTSTGEPLYTLELDGARVAEDDLLGGDARSGADTVRWIYEHALVALAATQVGVCERALEITSSYVSQREQFGVPIGTFQAVQHRAANGYIDLEAMRWVTWRAAWKLAQGRPAAREAAVAKFWAAEGGSRILNSAQHLHGGIGVDIDYPIHRYFLWSKVMEITLGSAMPQLANIGHDMARSGPDGI